MRVVRQIDHLITKQCCKCSSFFVSYSMNKLPFSHLESNNKFISFLVLFHRSTIHTLECYYCNDEEGYYCPQPFPLKSMFSNNKNYNEQMKNIAVSSGNKLLSEPIINCFVRKMIL